MRNNYHPIRAFPETYLYLLNILVNRWNFCYTPLCEEKQNYCILSHCFLESTSTGLKFKVPLNLESERALLECDKSFQCTDMVTSDKTHPIKTNQYTIDKNTIYCIYICAIYKLCKGMCIDVRYIKQCIINISRDSWVLQIFSRHSGQNI